MIDNKGTLLLPTCMFTIFRYMAVQKFLFVSTLLSVVLKTMFEPNGPFTAKPVWRGWQDGGPQVVNARGQ